ncbi:ArsR family transcriptional regulator [Nonomuraea sp. PA05]|uniref:arsenate reductase/protein-tyrosine-phosphatase family protein n=1 Tax=Nonomuraea sp. PA05 TaxID=2604466 RepID=UPI0011DA7F99|nr:ArsR family transcriptional regulator [Nonomuraea sp. PA05]TYB70950.1 ArsR family transcriptional regulator [Nonomuraea sp. PA05]
MVSSLATTPAFLRLAAHPLRWRLLSELAKSDYRVRELVELVGEPQNLVSYHLRLLRDGGLVTARRSTFDARDSYYHLDLERCAHALAATGAALHPALHLTPPYTPPHPAPLRPPARRPRVLFACTGNSARSPIAEALLRHRAGGHVETASAGSHPRDRLHPGAVTVLREHYGLDVRDRRPRHLDTVSGHRFDYVISLCDKVREVFPGFPGRPLRLHWSIPDPATADAAGLVRTAAEIDSRIHYLLPVLTSQEAPP